MKRKFTQNDLVRLIYNEADPIEAMQMWNAMKGDLALKSAYGDLLEAKESLNKERFSPSQTSLNIIMAHSRKSQGVSPTL